MTFTTDIHGPQRTNPNEFGDPDLSSTPSPPLSGQMSTVHTGCITVIIAADVHVPQRMNAIDLGDHVSFPPVHLEYKISSNRIARLT